MSTCTTGLLLCTLGLSVLAQEAAPPSPAPAPVPTPVTAPAPQPAADAVHPSELAALKADLEALQKRVRQQEEDEILRSVEARKAQAELTKKLALLEALPEQVKLAVEQTKAAQDQSTAQAKLQADLLRARLDGERRTLMAALKRLGMAHKELQELGPLTSLERALSQFQESTGLVSQPDFNALLAFVKDKLAKGPLGNPLKTPSVSNAYFANATLGGNWAVAAVQFGPGWESDKLKKLERALAAVDTATRLEGELKAEQVLLAQLKREVILLQSSIEETLQHALALLDPGASALDGEALNTKAEAVFKSLLEAVALGGLSPAQREALVELCVARDEAQARLLERRTLLGRIAAAAGGLMDTFGRYRKEASGQEFPALEPLIKAAEDARGRLKALLNNPGLEGKELAQLECAGYPVEQVAAGAKH